jgi:hypothetical protein
MREVLLILLLFILTIGNSELQGRVATEVEREMAELHDVMLDPTGTTKPFSEQNALSCMCQEWDCDCRKECYCQIVNRPLTTMTPVQQPPPSSFIQLEETLSQSVKSTAESTSESKTTTDAKTSASTSTTTSTSSKEQTSASSKEQTSTKKKE